MRTSLFVLDTYSLDLKFIKWTLIWLLHVNTWKKGGLSYNMGETIHLKIQTPLSNDHFLSLHVGELSHPFSSPFLLLNNPQGKSLHVWLNKEFGSFIFFSISAHPWIGKSLFPNCSLASNRWGIQPSSRIMFVIWVKETPLHYMHASSWSISHDFVLGFVN